MLELLRFLIPCKSKMYYFIHNLTGGFVKARLLLLSFFVLLMFAGRSSAQISNLKVGNSTSSFTMASGDSLGWSYNVSPAGATTTIEIWDDVNGNGTIDAGDVLWQSFTQTDGDTSGNNGPGDMDGAVNGAVVFGMHIGLAPVKYVMKFSEGGTTLTVAGTVTHLASVAHTISGTVTVPSGKSAANIFVEIEASGQGSKGFWDGVTDASGNYTIEMNADTSGNPWRARLANNPYAPAIVTPNGQDVTVAASTITGINFSIVLAAAQVDGTVKDESGNAVVGQDVELWRNGNSNSNVQYSGRTDVNGLFLIGAQSSDLIAGASWTLQVWEQTNNGQTGSLLDAVAQIPSLTAGDSLFKHLVIYSVNDSIQGKIEINGNPPGFPIQLTAQNQDTAQAYAWCESGTGNFSIPVSNKIYNYHMWANYYMQGYNIPDITAHPGQTGVVINITSTGVAEQKNIQPLEFSLGQNYPNPFNPTTQLRFTIADLQFVSLKVYDVLGREVATLVNEKKAPGTYEVQFDGSKLGSGMYFYTLRSGSFTETKQMILLK